MYMLVKVRFPALETDRCHSRLTGAVEEKSLKVAFVAWRCLSFIRRSDMSAWKIDTYSNRAYLNDWQPGPQDGSFALENTQPSNTLKNTRAKRATLNYRSKFILFENYSKCRIWILTFSTNFCLIKSDLSGNTVWPQVSGYLKNSPKWTISGIFN